MTRVERQPLLRRRRAAGGSRSRASVLARAVAALALSALGGLVVVAFASQALGFSAHVVTSGSMAPRVEPGDVVLTRATTAAELRAGQVLLFADPGRPGGLLLHRLVSFDHAGNLVTRGDANQSEDSVHVAPSAVRGVAQVRVPWVGLPAIWRAEGDLGLIALTGGSLAGAAVFVHSAGGRRTAGGADALPPRVGPGSSSGPPPPMRPAGTPAVPRTTARPGTWAVHDTIAIERVTDRCTRPARTVGAPRSSEEESLSASSAGSFLPPVPRPADGRDRAAGPARPAGRGYGRGDDHSRCFDGGRLCGQPRR